MLPPPIDQTLRFQVINNDVLSRTGTETECRDCPRIRYRQPETRIDQQQSPESGWLIAANHGVHQRIHRNDRRPDIIGYLILNPVQKDRAYDGRKETNHGNKYQYREFLKRCQHDQAGKNEQRDGINDLSFAKACRNPF